MDCDVSLDSMQFLTSCNGYDNDGCYLEVWICILLYDEEEAILMAYFSQLWDRRKAQVISRYTGHSQAVKACAFLPSPSDSTKQYA